MKLQRYLLREATIKTTGADIFLQDFVPVFMYNTIEGLLWAANPKKQKKWNIYRNNKLVTKEESRDWSSTAFTHSNLERIFKIDMYDENGFVMGRISPDGKTIYFHTPAAVGIYDKKYDYLKNKAVDAIYRYMKDHIK